MRVLGVPGSLRRDSHNRRLLRAVAVLLAPAAQLAVYPNLKALPPFDQDDETRPGEEVARWRRAIADADALVFATPEYNASIPGQLKNAIDWASRPPATAVLRNKPALVIGASTGMFGAVWAQAELRKALAAAGARVLDRELPVASADRAFDVEDRLAEADLAHELESMLSELVSAVDARATGMADRASDRLIPAVGASG